MKYRKRADQKKDHKKDYKKGFCQRIKIRGRSLLPFLVRVAFCACRRSDPPQAENSAKQEFFLFSGEVFLFDDLNRHILASPQFEGSSSLV